MKDKNSSIRYYDFLFVGYFSLTPIAILSLPNNLVLDNGFQIFLVSFFFASLPYVDKPKAYVYRVLISLLSASTIGVATTVLAVGLTGYEIFFVLVYVKLFIIPSVIAFVAALVYHKIIRNRISLESRVKMELSGLALTSVLGIFILAMQSSEKTDLTAEIHKRLELAERISSYYAHNQKVDLDTEKAMKLGLFEGLYSTMNNQPVNSYGGSISISSNPEGVSLAYKGIPGGDPCFWFYYMNSPSTYGFSSTYVDGVSTKPGLYTIDLKKEEKELCRSGQKSVSIRYFAPYESLKRTISFHQNNLK